MFTACVVRLFAFVSVSCLWWFFGLILYHFVSIWKCFNFYVVVSVRPFHLIGAAFSVMFTKAFTFLEL